jgi:hypothetical protein
MTRILGPVPCITCDRPVWWDRMGTDLRLMERRTRTQSVPHDCATVPGPLPKGRQVPVACGELMPIAGERCVRTRGHADTHRTAYALENARVSRRSGWAA